MLITKTQIKYAAARNVFICIEEIEETSMLLIYLSEDDYNNDQEHDISYRIEDNKLFYNSCYLSDDIREELCYMIDSLDKFKELIAFLNSL